MSLGHIINGLGKSVSHFGMSCFHLKFLLEQVLDFRPLSLYPGLHLKEHLDPPGWALVAQSGGVMSPFSKKGNRSHMAGSQLPKGLHSPSHWHLVLIGPLNG